MFMQLDHMYDGNGNEEAQKRTGDFMFSVSRGIKGHECELSRALEKKNRNVYLKQLLNEEAEGGHLLTKSSRRSNSIATIIGRILIPLMEVTCISDLVSSALTSLPEEDVRQRPEDVSDEKVELFRLKEIPQAYDLLDMNESCFETVQDMEEVLFDSGENSRAGYIHSLKGSSSHSHKSSSDGSAVAMKRKDLFSPGISIQHINYVEVIGARQSKGAMSLGERLVGLKSYTVYQLKVRQGKNQWEIERRYRDFVHLYHELKEMCESEENLLLPSSWSKVELESRKFFGLAPNLIEERSKLIEECLLSLIKAGPPYQNAPPLLSFLLPQILEPSDSCRQDLEGPLLDLDMVFGDDEPCYYSKQLGFSSQVPNIRDVASMGEENFNDNMSIVGNSVRLITKNHPTKPIKLLLESQHYFCPGCHKAIDVADGLIEGVYQNFVSGKPRLCEYTNQVFCKYCHTNQTAIIPARALHLWDFSFYPVSNLAKTYLDSIYDQPMLCVSAINPKLFSKENALVRAIDMRAELQKMFSCICCPAKESIQQCLGSRQYLLESRDFFSLRDLVHLSKYSVSGLAGYGDELLKLIEEHTRTSIKGPDEGDLLVLMGSILEKIHIHITELCSICDVISSVSC